MSEEDTGRIGICAEELYKKLINSRHAADAELLSGNRKLPAHLLNIYADDICSILRSYTDRHLSPFSEEFDQGVDDALRCYADCLGRGSIKEDKTACAYTLPYPVTYYHGLSAVMWSAWKKSQAEPRPFAVIEWDDRNHDRITVYYEYIVEYLMKKFAPVTFSKMTYIFDGRRYTEDLGRIAKEVERILKRDGVSTAKKIRPIVEEVCYRILLRSTIPTAGFLFNQTKIVPVRNGVLWGDYLLPHSPLWGNTYIVNVTYDEDATCRKIHKFFESLVSPENVPILYEIPALALLQNPWQQKAYMLVGSGSNGKSTYLQLITEFLGKENISNISLQDLAEDRFTVPELVGKLANIYADIPEKAVRYTGKFKILTGGDRITTQKKFKNPFHFQNRALLVFSANATPEVTDQSYAFWRRWIVLPFPNTFEEDPGFFNHIVGERELSGLLNKVLETMRRIERLGITKTKTIEEEREEWQRRSNTIYAFVHDVCERDDSVMITKDDLYRRYVEYCEAESILPKTKIEFGKELVRFASYVISEGRRINGRFTRVWRGIRVRGDNETAITGVGDDREMKLPLNMS